MADSMAITKLEVSDGETMLKYLEEKKLLVKADKPELI
jgi:hypothetical protein